MNLYLVNQTENGDYDSYDSFVCQANSEREAQHMMPDSSIIYKDRDASKDVSYKYSEWIKDATKVTVKYLGISVDMSGKSKVICASFNAG